MFYTIPMKQRNHAYSNEYLVHVTTKDFVIFLTKPLGRVPVSSARPAVTFVLSKVDFVVLLSVRKRISLTLYYFLCCPEINSRTISMFQVKSKSKSTFLLVFLLTHCFLHATDVLYETVFLVGPEPQPIVLDMADILIDGGATNAHVVLVNNTNNMPVSSD
jgi:hypothetical protein